MELAWYLPVSGGSPAEANGNMVANLIGDVLHVMVPEVLQRGLPREQFLEDLGEVQFAQCAFARTGRRVLQISFEDGSDSPYSIGFVGDHLRVCGREPVAKHEFGWIQLHLGPDVFSPIVEYRMLAYPVAELAPGMFLPEPPQVNFGPDRISDANRTRIGLFVDRFFELCGNDCYDFEEFLAEVYRNFRGEWEHIKHDLVEPWNRGAEKVGRAFLKVSPSHAEKLVDVPRMDIGDYL